MKKIVAIILMLITAGYTQLQAQSRFETMANQVAGLETYLKSMKAVYSTTENGLNDIHELKNGSFTLNQTYFNSLKAVSPAVKNDPKIKAISDVMQQIQSAIGGSLSWQQSKGQLTSDETSYLKSVYNNLLAECNKDLQELSTVITDGQVQMTDKQRLDKIDDLYKDMQQKNIFCQSFAGKAYAVATSRINDKSSTQLLKTLYNVN